MPRVRASLLDHPLISQRYFFPRYDDFPSPLLVDVEGARLACALSEVAPGAPVIVHWHGNGEVIGDWLDVLPGWFASVGWSVLLAEYRGYGMSSGEPELARMLEDVERVVRASGVPPEKMVFFGRSVGSLFAVHAASRFPQAAGLILESGIADVLERLSLRVDPSELGVTADELASAVRDRLDQRAKLRAYRGPVLILHTRRDGLIDVSHAEELARAAGGPVKLRVFERGDHNSIVAVNEAEYRDAVIEFVSGLSRAPHPP